MVDCITWVALATLGSPCINTVSSNMSAEFLRPAGTEGEYLYCEGTASKVGEYLSTVVCPSMSLKRRIFRLFHLCFGLPRSEESA